MFARFPYEKLLDWHAECGRHDLPWRRNLELRSEKDRGYRVWLSEILLQQTQAPRVAAFFERIVGRFPTVESLSETDFETFFPYYDGLGYYSRARNLLATAKEVVREYGGVFPRETESLQKLPGVGPYTAEAVRAFAYEIPTLPFDTNLEKVFSRYHFGDRFKKLSAEEKSRIVADFVRTGLSPRTVSGALMDFANLVSANSVSKVDWNGYPFPECRFFQTRGELENRPKKAVERFPMKDSVLVPVLFDHSGKTLFGRASSASIGRSGMAGLAHNGVKIAAAPPCHFDRGLAEIGAAPDLSEFQATYSPEFLPPTEGNPREAIKTHYLGQGIAVSVRPPYAKGFLDGAPLAFFRCRIQTGEPSGRTAFADFEFSKWWKTYSEKKNVDFTKEP